MTDRELLELAAKAAGCADVREGQNGVMVQWSPVLRGYMAWNPLADDGDALRLAVRLNMYVWVIGDTDTSMANDIQEKHIEQDRYEATRRAIVRAAAEIGKTI
jgi:Ser/Thr protein kinase RdoA (MazF antagonist)